NRVIEAAGLTPARTGLLVPFVQTGVEQIARRTIDRIQTAIHSPQPALTQITALYIQRAARQVDQGAGTRHHAGTAELHGAALGGPPANTMAGAAQLPPTSSSPPAVYQRSFS